ncbi:MAG: cupin domain-containing protein [Candidatus Micrarchaeota archaeon]
MEVKVTKPDAKEIEKLGAKSWPIWEKEESEFEWEYGEKETCLILEGRAQVKNEEGKIVAEFGAGDLVVFPEGLKCVWKITKKIRKHYKFG